MLLKQTKIYHSFSPEETKQLGEKFAKEIKTARGAAVFALQGDLGAGKTTFAQGFMRGLGLNARVQSPTFVIMRRHGLKRHKRFSDVFHWDAYRLKNAKSLTKLDFERILTDPKNIILVEWADRAKEILPKNTVWVRFAHGRIESERKISVIINR